MRGRFLAALLVLASCGHRAPPPSPALRYVVGAPYALEGSWYYPRESFECERTGLATTLPPRAGPATDGEAAVGAGMTGAHRTLQLPAIATVTNLENGRQVRIRLNERGPAQPGRLLGLSAPAAALLGIPEGGAAQVRLQIESGPSQALRDRLSGAATDVRAAPVGEVRAESLPPPGQGSAPGRARVLGPSGADSSEGAQADWLAPLPETVAVVPARPGSLFLDAGRFTVQRYANAVKSKLSPLPVEIRREGQSRAGGFAVLAGPFATVGEADRALDQARAAGVTDAAIVVE